MMREGFMRDWLAYAIAVICGSALPTTLPTSASEESNGLLKANAEPRAVIELFTSQGCSSCPPADKLLAQFATDPSLIPISLPIDYWDYLGWKDTLADPRNSARQRAYSHVRGDREVYTPQVVINGTLHAVGSDKEAIQAAIVQSRKDATTLSLPVGVNLADGNVLVRLPDGASGQPPAEVWIYGLLKAATVAIGRGENRGRTITYHNVARRWTKLGSWTGKGETWSVPIREFSDDGLEEVAVMVQSGTVDKPASIFGAAFAPIH